MTASVDVLPVVREYERSLATVLNARVMPAVSDLRGRLEERLPDAGIAAPLLLMQSNGGVAGAAAIRRAPAVTALSGPAAGVVGARDVAAAAGFDDLITVDIGGTSADICLIKDGRHRADPARPGRRLAAAAAHGGHGDRRRRRRLHRPRRGRRAAGRSRQRGRRARPGLLRRRRHGRHRHRRPCRAGPPARRLLGGRMELDAARPRRRCGRVAAPLGLSLHEAARGILAIADSNMVGAIRVVSVERGHDPRDFALVAVRRRRAAARLRAGRHARHPAPC